MLQSKVIVPPDDRKKLLASLEDQIVSIQGPTPGPYRLRTGPRRIDDDYEKCISIGQWLRAVHVDADAVAEIARTARFCSTKISMNILGASPERDDIRHQAVETAGLALIRLRQQDKSPAREGRDPMTRH
ncbi:hypothetical protein EVAR_79809_1 [Eumeta japonica]|uniref:Uncharacterized protein n=1 Tax=Eumeta variegata TaxID=151549 RepID=A0A4C1WU79_EUMVA|nr:hypothetical protein EVAR_79809_1 [Eumeta japonica]